MLKNKPFWLFCLLVIIFAVPMWGAWYAFQHPQPWIGRTTNKGVLISPLLLIDDLPLTENKTQQIFHAAAWKNKWVMLYIHQGACDKGCQKQIYDLQQVHKATGKYQDKVLSAFVQLDPVTDSALLQKYSQTIFLQTNTPVLANFLNNKNLLKQVLQQGIVFLVDPHGYVMMSYSPNADHEDIYKDLMHLLALN